MEDNKIVLKNDLGEEKNFEIVVTLEIDDKVYVLLADEENEGVFPFIYEEDENGEETLYPVEDEEEFQAIEEAYNQLSEPSGCGCSEHDHDCEDSGSCCCSDKE